MKAFRSFSLAGAVALGAMTLPLAAAVAAPGAATAGPLILVSGWASRVEGNRGFYDESYAPNYRGAYPYRPYDSGYGEPAYDQGRPPYGYGGYGYESGYNAY